MKRIFSVLLAVLFVLALPAAVAEEQPAGFTVPELYRTVSARLDPDNLPGDLPAQAVVVTSASFGASSLSVELSGPVPSLSVSQYNAEGDIVVVASAENSASLTADGIDASQGMADIILSWDLSGGSLVSTWSVWEDSTFDFVQCQYVTQSEGDRFAPYASEERVIELDERMNVLSDTRTLSGDMDTFVLTLDYDPSGELTEYACEWALGDDGTWFLVRTSADQVLTGISYHSGDVGFDAASDPVEAYLGGESRVLETVDYDEAFTDVMKQHYPQLPEPSMDYPIAGAAIATPTELSAPAVQGTLWVLAFGEDDSRSYVPFLTADPLFLPGDGTARPNSEAKDLNGAGPDLSGLTFELPAFSLPEIQR